MIHGRASLKDVYKRQGYDCCNGMCICNHDGGKCAGEKKEWKNSNKKSLKKLKKLVDNQGDLRYNLSLIHILLIIAIIHILLLEE